MYCGTMWACVCPPLIHLYESVAFAAIAQDFRRTFFLHQSYLGTRIRNPIVIQAIYLSFFPLCVRACAMYNEHLLFFAVFIFIIHLLMCLHPVMRRTTKGGGLPLYRCMNETLFKMKFFASLSRYTYPYTVERKSSYITYVWNGIIFSVSVLIAAEMFYLLRWTIEFIIDCFRCFPCVSL